MAACGAELISVDTHLMRGPCRRQQVPSAARVCLHDGRGRWGPGRATGLPVSFNLLVPRVCTSLFKGLLVPAKCPGSLWATGSISSSPSELCRTAFLSNVLVFTSLEVLGCYHAFSQQTWMNSVRAQDPCMDECMHAKSLQSYRTPCDPLDCSPPGSSVHGIF